MMDKELKETSRMMFHQVENINKKYTNYKKEPNKNSGVEKYKNWNETLTRRFQYYVSRQKKESELLGRPIEIIESEEQNDKRMKKNTTSETTGTSSSISIYA